jgi:beta-glucosidase
MKIKRFFRHAIALAAMTAMAVCADTAITLQADDYAKPSDTAIDIIISLKTEIDKTLTDKPDAKITIMPLSAGDSTDAKRNAAVNREMLWFRDNKKVFCGVKADRPDYEAGSHLWRTENKNGKRHFWWYERMKEKRDEIRASDGDFDIVMMGDSITHWWERNFGKDVMSDLRRTYSVLNLGYGGDKAETLLWRARYGELDGYKAKVVTIMIGTNNSTNELPSVVERIGEIVATVREKQPQAKILLMAIFPRCNPVQGHLRARSVWVSRHLEKFADGKNVIWCDFRPLFLKEDGSGRFDLLPDGTHPGPSGIRAWRDAMLPYFEKFTGKKHVPDDPVKKPCARRWISYHSDLAGDDDLKAANEFIVRAQTIGYNGICLDAFEKCAGWDSAALQRFAQVTNVCHALNVEMIPVLRQQEPDVFAATVAKIKEIADPAKWFVVTNGLGYAGREQLRPAIIRQTEMIAKVSPHSEILLFGRPLAGYGAGLSQDLVIVTGRDMDYFRNKGWRIMALFDIDHSHKHCLHEATNIFLYNYESKDERDGFIYWSSKGNYRYMLDAVRLSMRQQ